MKKQSKGITLIALVITIIILLILAGISISALTNQGLFKNAKIRSVISPSRPIKIMLAKIASVFKKRCDFKIVYPSPVFAATSSALTK